MAGTQFMRNGQWVSVDIARKMRAKELAEKKELQENLENAPAADEVVAEAPTHEDGLSDPSSVEPAPKKKVAKVAAKKTAKAKKKAKK